MGVLTALSEIGDMAQWAFCDWQAWWLMSMMKLTGELIVVNVTGLMSVVCVMSKLNPPLIYKFSFLTLAPFWSRLNKVGDCVMFHVIPLFLKKFILQRIGNHKFLFWASEIYMDMSLSWKSLWKCVHIKKIHTKCHTFEAPRPWPMGPIPMPFLFAYKVKVKNLICIGNGL